MNRDSVSGGLVIDKPEGPTSHDVVARVRKLTGVRVGHTGTLDPLATGVLPLLLGKATRLTRFYQGCDKAYLATLRLGVTTDTLDREGRVLDVRPVPEFSDADVDRLLRRFTGELKQLPPMFSAIRVKGERLYEAARRGETRERQSRDVTVYRLEIEERTSDRWTLRVECSAGTYVRSLAHDLGQTVGCGAHLLKLRRTRSGPYDLSGALDWGGLSRWRDHLQPLEELLPELPRLDLDRAAAERVCNGGSIPCPAMAAGNYQRLFYCGRLLSVSETRAAVLQPVIVFSD